MMYCSPLYVSHQYSSKKMHNKYLWKEGRKERKNKERKEEELPMNWDLIVASISYSAHMISPHTFFHLSSLLQSKLLSLSLVV